MTLATSATLRSPSGDCDVGSLASIDVLYDHLNQPVKAQVAFAVKKAHKVLFYPPAMLGHRGAYLTGFVASEDHPLHFFATGTPRPRLDPKPECPASARIVVWRTRCVKHQSSSGEAGAELAHLGPAFTSDEGEHDDVPLPSRTHPLRLHPLPRCLLPPRRCSLRLSPPQPTLLTASPPSTFLNPILPPPFALQST